MIKINQIHVEIANKLTKQHIAHKLHCKETDILSYTIDKESLDARKNELHYSYTVFAEVRNENKYLKLKDVTLGKKEKYELPSVTKNITDRPIVVGFGPAGMFSALILAECGLKPIVIERGKCVEERSKDIDAFFHEGKLNTESNVQYGEGGAGTFSDGKLTTRMKNVRISKVLDEFVEAGAQEEITYQHRPHLGTDQLQDIVKNIRLKVISLGGEVHFNTKLEQLLLDNHKVIGVNTNQGNFMSHTVLLCIGHSASDTYEKLLKQGTNIEQKDFAIGVRVEHPQQLINQNTYGKYANEPSLGAASYQLTAKTSVNRGVYSFCMCPGGVVVPASTEENTLAVNGMSYQARDGKNANSAILVQIQRSDFDHGHPLDGFTFQKELEKKAYRSNYNAPSMNIKDYVQHTQTTNLVIESSYPRGLSIEDMHSLFSSEVNQALEEGFQQFDKRIPGFINQGIMVGMESRSSSPIRLLRDEFGCSISIEGLFPSGEGAGYAGGIISSAVDGIKQAENVINYLLKNI